MLKYTLRCVDCQKWLCDWSEYDDSKAMWIFQKAIIKLHEWAFHRKTTRPVGYEQTCRVTE